MPILLPGEHGATPIKAIDQGDGTQALKVSGLAYTALVAGLAGLSGRSNAQQTGTVRFRLVVIRATTRVKLVYSNYYKTGVNPQETANTNSISVKAAIEYSGVTYPIFFGGSRTAVIAGGATVVSDALALALPAGALPFVRTYWDAGAAGFVPNQAMQAIGGGFGGVDSYTYGVDSVDAIGALATATPAVLYGPSAMLSDSVISPTVAILGDSTVLSSDIAFVRASITSGSLGYPSGDGGGWAQRGLRQLSIAYTSVAFGSERALDFAGSNIAIRLPLVTTLTKPTHWLIIYGRGDLVGGVTAADIQTRLLAIANLAISYGIRPIAATIPPKSTDSATPAWAVPGTQTTDTTNSVRTAVNDWIRTTPAPFVAYVEVADQLETARNSGIWTIGPVQSSGTATAATSTTLTRTPALWVAQQFADGDRAVRITSGTGAGQTRIIGTNTTTQLTITVVWTVTPDATSTFEIFPRYTVDGTHLTYYGDYLVGEVLEAQFAAGLP